jgi:hypothetical protein
MILSVYFASEEQAVIVSYFGEYSGSPPDREVFSFWGTVDTDDARWKTFYESVPFMQEGLPPPTVA